MFQPMPIPEITRTIVNCWMSAEVETRRLLSERHPDKDEEFITDFFHGELRNAVKKANSSKYIKDAFLRDLGDQFSDIRNSFELEEIAKGITATVTKHSREVEGSKTGGDIGITIIRPSVIADSFDPSLLHIEYYQRGLLCQAKIKRRPTKSRKRSYWDTIKGNQMNILSNHLDYLSLLLYEYNDVQRQNLRPFGWQLCIGYNLDEINTWFSKKEFPNRIDSEKIISKLGNDLIGTDDIDIIKQFINPKVRPSLIFRIGWPKPPEKVRVTRNIQHKQEQKVKL